MILTSHGHSDVGFVREKNEDSFLVDEHRGIYAVADGVSKCHTLGDELIDKHGPEAAIDMPEHYMHTLTRCMGQDIDFEVDIGEIAMVPGSSILICSDGITNMIELPEIEKMINELDPTSLIHSLIDLANQNGGTDNSTAVCLKIS